MYDTNISNFLNKQKIFTAGIKMYEFIKLSVQPGIYKNTDNKEWLTYMIGEAALDLTVVDIGNHKREYLFDIIKVANHYKRLIAFEADVSVCNYLTKMIQWLKLKNVTIEKLSLPTIKENEYSTKWYYKKNESNKTPVIDIKERINKEVTFSSTCGFLDQYFLLKQLKPDLLKIKTDGNELEILKGCIKTIKKCTPKILLECRETQRSRDRLLATFKFLTDLHYSGYFILDTMKIPLANFDFNIYQNEVYGFYCNNFLFE